jgi:SRSO17 transposase
LHGLLIANERTLKGISRTVPEARYQAVQNFITDSTWDEDAVIGLLQRDADRLIGDPREASLHVDGSGFPKSGDASVGAKDQYCGHLGKVANCQVGVYLGLVNGGRRILIGERLYLPSEWVEDPARREMCGVPDGVAYRSRPGLAQEMLIEAKRRGVRSAWVGMDSEFGKNAELRPALDEAGLVYVADIPSTWRVWLREPCVGTPARRSRTGRPPSKVRVLDGEPAPVEVRELAATLPRSAWYRELLRDTERGELWADVACLRVYPVEDGLPGKEVWLIIRKGADGEKDVKYQLSNAPPDTSRRRLARMSSSRYWMERAIQDAKGEAGMGEYQVRGWRAWHHHMAMSMLATLVLLELQIEVRDDDHPFTPQDVRLLIGSVLPRRQPSLEEAYDEVRQRIRERESARRSHHRRNGMKAAR